LTPELPAISLQSAWPHKGNPLLEIRAPEIKRRPQAGRQKQHRHCRRDPARWRGFQNAYVNTSPRRIAPCTIAPTCSDSHPLFPRISVHPGQGREV